MTAPEHDVVDVDTSEGVGRWHLHRVSGAKRAQLLLGHGAGGGVEARDLVALAAALPEAGVEVARFEQPWRVQGRKVATPPARLDAAWLQSVPAVRTTDVPLIVGGRSAGARVACRTAEALEATGVLALAFPLHPPGRPERSRADELPSRGGLFLPGLFLQGARDLFGSPEELAACLDSAHELCAIPAADHAFAVPRSGPITEGEAMALIIDHTRRWADLVIRAARR